MAADAFLVPLGEQCRRRHDRLFTAMALGARAASFRRRGVLMLVAGRADLDRRFAVRSMSRRDGEVAVRAGSGLGPCCFVGCVTVDAFAAAVDGHGRSFALLNRMTARAVRRSIGLVWAGVEGDVPASFEREGVAARAVGLHALPEAFTCLFTRVFELGFLRVAGAATRWACGTDGAFGELVALDARDLLLHHVHLVPGHGASILP